MLSPIVLLTNLLLASAALAAPSRLAARLQRRADGRQSEPLIPITPNGVHGANGNLTANIQYSSNWAGGVHQSPANTWKTVTGTFLVPTPKLNPGQTWASASAWVGIDGDSCQNAILQTGIDFTISNGQVTYGAWYEWWPDYAYDFSSNDISIHAGDEITLTVTAYSKNSGIAVISNHNTKQTVSKYLTSTHALCEQDAEWIVEDYQLGGQLVPLANWGRVHFKKASATTWSGKTVGPKGATIIAIVDSQGNVVTETKLKDSHVDVTYI